MTAEFDPSLIKKVHEEDVGGLHIRATISRFGGLAVFVWAADWSDFLWHGDNILAARAWATERTVVMLEEVLQCEPIA